MEKKTGNSQNYIVFDFETGGLDSKKHAITEVAMLAIDGESLEEIDRYSSFIQPYSGLEYSQEALDITGITMDMINTGKTAKQVANDMVKFFKATGIGRKKPILCGHNIIAFDIPFMEVLFTENKKDLYKSINEHEFLDTMWMSRHIWTDPSMKHNLTVSCEREGVEIIDAHRAINDVAANTELLKSYLKRMRGAGEISTNKDQHNYREDFNF